MTETLNRKDNEVVCSILIFDRLIACSSWMEVHECNTCMSKTIPIKISKQMYSSKVFLYKLYIQYSLCKYLKISPGFKIALFFWWNFTYIYFLCTLNSIRQVSENYIKVNVAKFCRLIQSTMHRKKVQPETGGQIITWNVLFILTVNL